MGWGQSPADQRAAEQAAEVAAERVRARMAMTPFQRQLLDVLGEIRDALVEQAAAVVTDQLADGIEPPSSSADEPFNFVPVVAGSVTGPPCSCGRELWPTYHEIDIDDLAAAGGLLSAENVAAWHHRDDQTPACPGAFTTTP